MTPEMNNDTFDVELANHIWNEIKGMKNSTYIPTTKAELIAMDNFDLKTHMMLNEAFYNAAIMLLDNEVNMYVAFLKEMDDELADVESLDALLRHTQFFGENYEDSRTEFVSCFVEIMWPVLNGKKMKKKKRSASK